MKLYESGCKCQEILKFWIFSIRKRVCRKNEVSCKGPELLHLHSRVGSLAKLCKTAESIGTSKKQNCSQNLRQICQQNNTYESTRERPFIHKNTNSLFHIYKYHDKQFKKNLFLFCIISRSITQHCCTLSR